MLDNFDNIQINIYMLFLACLSVFYFIRGKSVPASFFLALSISIKVYTIFLFLYFLFKREFKTVAWTLFFLVLINSVSLLVFGTEKTIDYYTYWYREIASPPPTIHHKNQSLFGLMLRFLTGENPGIGFYVNFLSIKAEAVKKFTYLFILVAALYPAIRFRHKLTDRKSMKAIFEYSFVLSAIPLLTPLAWQPYFVFLWFSYMLVFVFLYQLKNTLNPRLMFTLRLLFMLSVVLNIFSTEGIVGNRFSDVLETLSCITFGTLIVLFIQFVLYLNLPQFDIFSLRFFKARK